MRYLLDVSTLMALLWERHEHHARVTAWQDEAELAVCPLSELGFLRISSQPALGASVQDARRMLRDWKQARKPAFVPCDIDALEGEAPPGNSKTTDFYLSNLAAKHGMVCDAGSERWPQDRICNSTGDMKKAVPTQPRKVVRQTGQTRWAAYL